MRVIVKALLVLFGGMLLPSNGAQAAEGLCPKRYIDPSEFAASVQLQTDGKGTYLAVWTLISALGYGPMGIVFARSTDGGQTWSAPLPLDGELPTGDFAGKKALACATDTHGNWLVLWSHFSFEGATEPEQEKLYVSRSEDNGATWMQPVTLDTILPGSFSDVYFGEVATDSKGTWLIVWRSNSFGNGSDLYSIRSTDNGLSWSQPAPVNTDYLTDGYEEVYPSIATDGKGLWMVAWSRNTPDPNPYGFDNDVFVTRSSDAGQSWAPPLPVNNDASFDALDDGYFGGPFLRTDKVGGWFVAWGRSSFVAATSHSLDAGLSWSDLVETSVSQEFGIENGIVCCQPLFFLSDFSIDSSGAQLITFVLGHYGGDTVPYYADVFALKSLNYGTSWSVPFSISPSAATDNRTELSAAIVNDGRGRWMIAKSAHDNLDFFGQTLPYPALEYTFTSDLAPPESIHFDFTDQGGSHFGWTPALNQGSGSTALDSRGLSVTVPREGDNIITWTSPDRTLPLVDGDLWKLTIEMETDQWWRDALPTWEIGFDNANALFPNKGMTYGGSFAFTGNAAPLKYGGGKYKTIQTYEVWISPAASNTPQWTGELADGTQGAFAESNNPFNDIRLWFRVRDVASEGNGAERDFGTIRLRSIKAERISVDRLRVRRTLFNAPLSNSTHWPFDIGENPLEAYIDYASHTANYRLNPISDRASLLPATDFRPPRRFYRDPESFFPIQWRYDTLYRVSFDIQLAESSSGVDPIDLITFGLHSSSGAIGTQQLAARGIGSFKRAGSPRKASVAGGPQSFVLYFEGNGGLASGKDWMKLLQPRATLENRPDLYGSTTGSDALEILNMKVEELSVAP